MGRGFFSPTAGLAPAAPIKGEVMDRATVLQQVVDSADRYTMRSARGRQQFAHRLAHELHLWEEPVQEFVREMTGLNFFHADDRQAFIQFFCHAYRIDV